MLSISSLKRGLDRLQVFAEGRDVSLTELLDLPLRSKVLKLFLDLVNLVFDLGQAIQRVLLRLVLEHPLGKLELQEPALEDIDLGRDRLQFHGQTAGGFVNQVDCLVGQETVGDVPRGELGGGDKGRVADLDLVMDLVSLFQAPEDGHGILDRGFADEDGLKSAFEGGVLLDILAKLVERGRADAAELAPGERGFEQVRGVHRAFGLAGTDDKMQLVDEQDDPAFRRSHFLQNRLQSLLELAAKLGPGDERPPCRAP